jgi:hypothetical protein
VLLDHVSRVSHFRDHLRPRPRCAVARRLAQIRTVCLRFASALGQISNVIDLALTRNATIATQQNVLATAAKVTRHLSEQRSRYATRAYSRLCSEALSAGRTASVDWHTTDVGGSAKLSVG